MSQIKSERTTHEQRQFYIEFCRKHPEWQSSKNNPNQPRRIQDFWEKLASHLNSMRGPTRTANRWKESLSNWKNQVRSRARMAKAGIKGTGGGPKVMDISEFEQQALDVLGASAVDGLEGMFALGVEDAVAGSSTQLNATTTQMNDNQPNGSNFPGNVHEIVSSETVEEEMHDDENISSIIAATPSPLSSSTPETRSSSLLSANKSTDELLHVLLDSMRKRDEREEHALEQQRMLTEALLKITETLAKINNVCNCNANK